MIFLHHYPMSPFSEKMRLMFGYCGLTWQSVISPESPPRPIVDPLTGGYRRIPVAQVGADVFCDTRLISVEVSRLTGKAELDPSNADVLNQRLAERCEGEVFMAAVSSIPPRRMLGRLFRELSVTQAVRFLGDRMRIARHMQSRPVSAKKAGPLLQDHLHKLESMLAGGQPYLAGDSPAHLDFAAYHPLWFRQQVGGLPIPPDFSRTNAWYQRLPAFGHGKVQVATGKDAHSVARGIEPRPIPAAAVEGDGVGQRVVVRPDDYALDGTSGVLVGVDDERWIVSRDTRELGRIHVHFPRRGFCLT